MTTIYLCLLPWDLSLTYFNASSWNKIYLECFSCTHYKQGSTPWTNSALWISLLFTVHFKINHPGAQYQAHIASVELLWHYPEIGNKRASGWNQLCQLGLVDHSTINLYAMLFTCYGGVFYFLNFFSFFSWLEVKWPCCHKCLNW